MSNVNIGMIGSGLTGKLHSISYKLIPICFSPTPANLHLKAISDETEDLAKKAMHRFGFNEWIIPWNKLIERDDLNLIDIVTPNNLHKPMCIEAAEAGKNIICEKPLALNSEEAEEIYRAAEKAKIKHCVSFNYRRTSAVMLAKKLIEEGRIGKIYHFRAFYLQDWPIDPDYPLSWRFRKALAGSGALGDLGSHIIDLGRFLVGEFDEVMGLTETKIKERPILGEDIEPFYRKTEISKGKGKVDVDDATTILARFKDGATGVIEVSRLCYGRKNFQYFEINGSKGSLIFNFEKMDELQFYSSEDPPHIQGFRTILTGPPHPYGQAWWPIAGLSHGYLATFTNTLHDLIVGIVNDKEVWPSFYDGWKCAQICDAVIESAERRLWVNIQN